MQLWLDDSPGQDWERHRAQRMLLEPNAAIDRESLIARIISALKEHGDANSPWKRRAWLLGSLARIAEGNPAAQGAVADALDPKHQPEPFVRYWTLAGAYAGQSRHLRGLAERALADPDPEVNRLAQAILAGQGDESALEALQRGLAGDERSQVTVLRALGVVPLPALREPVAGIEREARDEVLRSKAQLALEHMDDAETGSAGDDADHTIERGNLTQTGTGTGTGTDLGAGTSGSNGNGSGERKVWIVARPPDAADWGTAAESPLPLPVDGKTGSRILEEVSERDLLVLYQTGRAQRLIGLGSAEFVDLAASTIHVRLIMLFDEPIGRDAFQGVLPKLLRRAGTLKPIEPEEWATLREIIRFHAPQSDALMPAPTVPQRAGCELELAGDLESRLTPGAPYDLALKVVNTGNLSWRKGDSLLLETPGLTKEDPLLDGVPPGGEWRVDVTREAPKTPGPFTSTITARIDRFGTDFSPGTLTYELEVQPSSDQDGYTTLESDASLPAAHSSRAENIASQTAPAPEADISQAAEAAPTAATDAIPEPDERAPGPTTVTPTAAPVGTPFPAAAVPATIVQLQRAFEPPDPHLELHIHRGTTTLSFDGQDYQSPTALDFKELGELRFGSPEAYGARLFAGIIRTERTRGAQFLDTRHGYQEAVRWTAREVRFELLLDAADAELRSLPWEYLTDPEAADTPLAVNQNTPFYRLVGSQPKGEKPRLPFRVLVAIASPKTLGQPGNRYLKDLASLDVARERQIIVDALTPLEAAGVLSFELLDQAAGEGAATIENLAQRLEQGHQVLHLMAHGFFIDSGEYCVALPGKENPHELVTALGFRKVLAGHQLRMALLQTCQSFSVASATSGQALGLELVEAGIPAVISMQGLLPVETAQLFTQHFYHDLARSGRVDMALAATRHALYLARRRSGSAWDWGIPVLQLASSDGELFDVKPDEGARLGEPAPHIKAADELPSSTLVSRATKLADGIVRELSAAFAAAGANAPALAPLGEQIRDRLAAALPETAAPPAEAPQDREALRWALRGRVRLRAPALRDWIERETGMRLLPSVYRQVVSVLNAGKHLVLIGPPGTGKTTLAHAICSFAREQGVAAGMVPTTASADWTTFDTVGGYAMTQGQTLEFRPGIFLRAIAAGHWLVIDEINRAEIDKAVGELFTLLAGQQVDLPYRIASQRVRILPPAGADPENWVPADAGPFDYVVHPNWRIVATMNVYDKSSLFSLSFAFMRRFAFVDVGVPHHDNLFHGLRDRWLEDGLGASTAEPDRAAVRDKMSEIFRQGSPLMRRRELGPAIARDMLAYLGDRVGQMQEEFGAGRGIVASDLLNLLGEAFLLYAVPQLDGLDREAALEIFGHLDGIFDGTDTGGDVLQRMRDLYPHIREQEWEVALRRPPA